MLSLALTERTVPSSFALAGRFARFHLSKEQGVLNLRTVLPIVLSTGDAWHALRGGQSREASNTSIRNQTVASIIAWERSAASPGFCATSKSPEDRHRRAPSLYGVLQKKRAD